MAAIEKLEPIISLKEVIAATSMSKSTIRREMLAKRFPPSIKLGAQRVGWIESEVVAWIRERRRRADPQDAEPSEPSS